MTKFDKKTHAYDDIIHLPHHESKTRPKMANKDRAAQFSPFAAVVGHEAAVKEAARITDQKRDLDETEKAVIDESLRTIESHLSAGVIVSIEYFKPDVSKAGGQYVQISGQVKKIDVYDHVVIMSDGSRVSIEDILSIVIEEY